MSTRSRLFVCAVLLVAACKKDNKPADQPETPSTNPKPTDQATPATAGKIPVTTKSPEARALFDKALALQLALRATDAYALYEQAVAKDPEFALGYVGLANTAPTNAAFFTALEKAVALADKVSEPERQWIKGLEAGTKNDPAGQEAAYKKVVELAPADPQALNLVAQLSFGRQEYEQAIDLFNKLIALDPKFAAAYNQLGYAQRFVEKYDEAEATFKKYIELIPNDPNPYDSYAELLMKRGKYDESIASYEKALSIDPNFVASYIGIGNNHMFAGRGDKAREAFAKMGSVARNPGEQRQALLWTAVSYTHEGKWDDALAQVDKMEAIAVKGNDIGAQAGDHNTRANFLLEAGKVDAAAVEFAAQLDTIAKADVPDQVKEGARRNGLYDQARIAIAKHDLATAKAKLAEFGTQVEAKGIPFEKRQHHQLVALIALEDKKFAEAATHLEQANQQDPRVLYLLGVAYAGAGDADKAKAAYQRAYDYNGLALNYGYVRGKAKRALGPS